MYTASSTVRFRRRFAETFEFSQWKRKYGFLRTNSVTNRSTTMSADFFLRYFFFVRQSIPISQWKIVRSARAKQHVLRRVAPVPGHRRPRVVHRSAAVVTVASATGVVRTLRRVRGRRSATRSHRHGQRGDLLGRSAGLAAAPFPVVRVVEIVHPAAAAAALCRWLVHAAGPATTVAARLFFESARKKTNGKPLVDDFAALWLAWQTNKLYNIITCWDEQNF